VDGVKAKLLDCRENSGAELPSAQPVDEAHHQGPGPLLLRHACAASVRRSVRTGRCQRGSEARCSALRELPLPAR
jgi:hypothetical protein